IHAQLGDKRRAAGELHQNVDVREKLYVASPSAERRLDYLQALTDAVRNATNWGIADAVPVTQWKEAIKAHAGESAAEVLTRPQPEDALPRWLEKNDPPGWPTVPLKSTTLRYSLRIP